MLCYQLGVEMESLILQIEKLVILQILQKHDGELVVVMLLVNQLQREDEDEHQLVDEQQGDDEHQLVDEVLILVEMELFKDQTVQEYLKNVKPIQMG